MKTIITEDGGRRVRLCGTKPQTAAAPAPTTPQKSSKPCCSSCGAPLTKRNTALGTDDKCKPCRNAERAQWWAEHPEESRLLTIEQAMGAELLPRAKR